MVTMVVALAFFGMLTNAVGYCTSPASIEASKFSLNTGYGQSVFRKKFGQNEWGETSDRLDLNFNAMGQQFQFELQRSSVFDPEAVVRIIGNVCGHIICSLLSFLICTLVFFFFLKISDLLVHLNPAVSF